MKRVLVAAMLVASVIGGVSPPARAGVISDAMVSAGSWIARVENVVGDWLDRLWLSIGSINREDRAADAFRQLAVRDPGQLDALAGRAGYALSGFALAGGYQGDIVLRFRHARDLTPDERRAVKRDLADPVVLDMRPEFVLLRLLLDAADWRDAAAGGRYGLTGVEIRVDDKVSSRLIFSETTVTQ